MIRPHRHRHRHRLLLATLTLVALGCEPEPAALTQAQFIQKVVDFYSSGCTPTCGGRLDAPLEPDQGWVLNGSATFSDNALRFVGMGTAGLPAPEFSGAVSLEAVVVVPAGVLEIGVALTGPDGPERRIVAVVDRAANAVTPLEVDTGERVANLDTQQPGPSTLPNGPINVQLEIACAVVTVLAPGQPPRRIALGPDTAVNTLVIAYNGTDTAEVRDLRFETACPADHDPICVPACTPPTLCSALGACPNG